MCVLTDIIKQPLLDQELAHLAYDAFNTGKFLSPATVMVVANQVNQINSIPQLQSYLLKGTGLTKKESGIYIGCLLLQYTNQIN